MSLRIRPVEFAADREELLSVLRRNLQDVPHEERLAWLYRDNPAGPALSWFLCDEQGAAVGITSLFPHAVWLDGTAAICGQVGDFGVDTRFRSLGPAIMLQRATFEPVVRGDLAFCYDCPPHEKGMAMFHRLGLRENCRMHAYVKPLRADRQLQRLLGRTAGGVAASVANPLLGLATRRAKNSRGLEFSLHAGEFGPEFSTLDQSEHIPGAVRNRRSAEDLNWRFRQNPQRQFEVLTARRRGELLAYVAFGVVKEDVGVVDLFGHDLNQVGPLLLQALAEVLRPRAIQTLRALVAGDSPCAAIFRQAGFSLRDNAIRVVAFGGAQDKSLRDAHWQFQYSDVMA